MSLSSTLITVYKDVYSMQPQYVPLSHILERIKTGQKCRGLVEQVRKGDTGAKLKLPAIVFSGRVEGNREDANLRQHSNMVILDFDHLGHRLPEVRKQMTERTDVVAVFLSPGGDGLKVLVRIADGAKHRQHYKALVSEIEGLDEKNINESRACFESYDPAMYINYNARPYNRVVEPVKVETQVQSGPQAFGKLEKWLTGKGNVFASGNRNNYIFCLASACCRFGIGEEEATEQIKQNYLLNDTGFTIREALSAIRSAYKRNQFASAEFKQDILVERQTRKEVEVNIDDHLVHDVIYGADVYDDALDIFRHGYKSADTTGVAEIDEIFKWKRGELTVISGIANHGKSSILMFLMLNKSAVDGTKWAIFTPESYPAHEFYHSLTEMVLGRHATPANTRNKNTEEEFKAAYDFVKDHIFFIYPKDLSPTPEYVKSRFLELIIKEKVSGCVVDPFNQLSNDYKGANGRDDRYLETLLSDITRFSIINNVYMVIVCHPVKQRKNGAGGYDCPDVYDLAGGAMWNNKADNVLIYHRPNAQKDPNDPTCELHSKKIRRQKIVGKLGMVAMYYNRHTLRFDFGHYPLQRLNLTPVVPITTEKEEDGEEVPF
jgi:VirE N-terminal domain/DnaB-like helicase C terminal domain